MTVLCPASLRSIYKQNRYLDPQDANNTVQRVVRKIDRNGNSFDITTGTWIFRPRSQTKIAIPGGDREFMYFGWWIGVPDSAEGTYEFEPRVGGTGLAVFSGGTGTGIYRYKGSATGRYVKQDRSKTVESDGDFLTRSRKRRLYRGCKPGSRWWRSRGAKRLHHGFQRGWDVSGRVDCRSRRHECLIENR